MSDAPIRIGLISDGLGNYALAHKDEADAAVHYVREDASLAMTTDMQAAAEARGYRKGLEDAAKVVEDTANVRCDKCGHPRNNHPYRHPFVTSARPDIAAVIRAIDTK